MLANWETLSRVLERASALNRSEAVQIMYECPTEELVAAAGRVRDITRPKGVITYSRKVFINLINLCRDTCSYCTYKKNPSDPKVSMLNPTSVFAIAEAGKRALCTEALFVTGERPEQKYG